jgi:glycosyltransferase involved in cell wall biosynthesis
MIPQVISQVQSLLSVDTSTQNKRVGILIITYNAVDTVIQVLRRIPAGVMDSVEEVVIFDDASQDHTFEAAYGYKSFQGIDKLTVIRNERNLGYGGNQKKGYRYFLEKGFNVVVLLHGDGQYAPEMLAAMYRPIVEGRADAVFGSRMMTEFGGALRGGMPFYKFLGNRILTYYENRALKMNLTEFHSGYRAYSLHALRQINFVHMTDDFHFDTEIIIKLHHQRFRIHEIPIPTYYGDEISYVNGFRYAWDVYLSVRHYLQTVRSVRRNPEFAEYYVHYPIKETKYSSHYYIEKMVGAGRHVLDCACGEGMLAAHLMKNGNTVIGIDILDSASELPPDVFFSADLESGLADVRTALTGQTFDVILLADILEHLRNPDLLLDDCRAYLKPNGTIIISLPNVANIYVRLSLLLGQFNYADRGIMDRTHLWWFTRKTARALIHRHGFKIKREAVTVIPVDLTLGFAPDAPPNRLLIGLLHILTALFPTLFGYQLMFEICADDEV